MAFFIICPLKGAVTADKYCHWLCLVGCPDNRPFLISNL